MKMLRRIIPILLIAAMTVGCKAFRIVSSTSQNSQGKPYELIVACSQELWTGTVGDSLKSLLLAPVPYLNQREPLFDVLRVTESGLTGLVGAHRNILKVLVDPTLKEAAVGVQYDVTAQPQIMMTLQGPSASSLIDYLAAHGSKMVEALEMAERDRDIRQYAKFQNEGIAETVKKLFGIEMNVPKGYVLAKEQEDFIWARFEYPTASQGFMLYSYPYAGPESLTEKALVAARNQYAARIPGPSDGSYMTTSDVVPPAITTFTIEGRPWCEMRGFWDVSGDFMGGPFVSYTTVNNGKVFTLDCYVYSPKLHKRNFVRGVEHLIYGIRFPGEKPVTVPEK